MLKRLLYMVPLTAIAFLFIASNAMAFESSIARQVQLVAYDTNNTNFISPSFRFAVKLPDGNLIGWDKGAEKWTGAVKESYIKEGEFDYPDPGTNCKSDKPYTNRDISFSSNKEIEGSYATQHALYCRDNIFYGSAYSAIIGGVQDGKIEVKILPEANAIVFLCTDSLVLDFMESTNMFCDEDKYNRNLILSPGVEQAVELNYVHASAKETVVNKVVTPETLSGAWEACRDMGLTKNSGLYTSVYKKLKNAKELHTKGKKKAAMNVNRAAAKEIEAQRGKGIDPLCADIMLKDLRAELR